MAIRTPDVLLTQAAERLESGDVVSAACHAREALRRHLRSLCDDHGCRPTGRNQTPRDFIKALRQTGMLTEAEQSRLSRLVNDCHRAAHLLCIRPNRMRAIIDSAWSILSGPVELPAVG
jgi:hypothetical protein